MHFLICCMLTLTLDIEMVSSDTHSHVPGGGFTCNLIFIGIVCIVQYLSFPPTEDRDDRKLVLL